jgi:hypothetical protein
MTNGITKPITCNSRFKSAASMLRLNSNANQQEQATSCATQMNILCIDKIMINGTVKNHHRTEWYD